MTFVVKAEIDFTYGPTNVVKDYVDVTSDLVSVSTSRGRTSALSRDEAGTCDVVLNNPAGKYDPRNSNSPFAGNIKIKRRIRIAGTSESVDTWLNIGASNNPDYASACYDSSESQALPVGNLDLRVDCALLDWASVLASRYFFTVGNGPVGSDFGIRFSINEGFLGLTWNDSNGVDDLSEAVSTDPVSFGNEDRAIVRVTLSENNGSSVWEVNFYTSTDDGDTWDQLGDPVLGSTTSARYYESQGMAVGCQYDSSTTTPAMGGIPNIGQEGASYGNYYRVLWLDDIDGDTYMDLDFRSIPSGSPFANVIASNGSVFYVKDPARIERDIQTSGVFTGMIDSYRVGARATRKASFVELDCSDLFSALAESKLTLNSDSQLAHVWIRNVLQFSKIQDWQMQLSHSGIYLAPVSLDGISALEHIQHIVETELGRFFISSDGNFVFLNRPESLYGNSGFIQATFGDAIAVARGHDIDLEIASIPSWSLSDREIYNSVKISRVDGDPYVVEDEESQNNYYKHELSRENMLYLDDDSVSNLAAFLLASYKDPKIYIDPITVDVLRDPETIWPIASGLELGDMVQVITYYDQGTTPSIEVQNIDKINFEWTKDTCRFTYFLSPITSLRVARYGSAVYGTDTYTI